MKIVLLIGAAFGESRLMVFLGFLLPIAGLITALQMTTGDMARDVSTILVGMLIGLHCNVLVGWLYAKRSQYAEQLSQERKCIGAIIVGFVSVWTAFMVGARMGVVGEASIVVIVITVGLMVPVWFSAGIAVRQN